MVHCFSTDNGANARARKQRDCHSWAHPYVREDGPLQSERPNVTSPVAQHLRKVLSCLILSLRKSDQVNSQGLGVAMLLNAATVKV